MIGLIEIKIDPGQRNKNIKETFLEKGKFQDIFYSKIIFNTF